MGSTRRIIATVATTVTLSVGAVFGGAATPAHAQTNNQNGLVNVGVGNVNVLNNARIGVAAQVAASVCGVNVGPVAVLAANVDATGVQRTVCDTANGPVTISNA